MDEPISKISKDRDRKGFDTRRHEAFLANRISDIPEKTGWILNCRFPSLWIWYDFDFFTILLRIFWRKFFGVKFCNMTPKGQIWNMTRIGSYYIAYEKTFFGEIGKKSKMKSILNNRQYKIKLIFWIPWWKLYIGFCSLIVYGFISLILREFKIFEAD